jgi:hypothetical protein
MEHHSDLARFARNISDPKSHASRPGTGARFFGAMTGENLCYRNGLAHIQAALSRNV